ncbi:hypothetical protein G6F56_013219 [Rhizopus delemar]|nr:hypothetical protein G6F56_013219 [Rhizopus delemar]
MSSIQQQEFSDPEFNPKQWINSVLNQENEDKETTVLVTKLQMASQDCSQQFDQLSTTVIKSMPRLLYDLKLVSENAHGIQKKLNAAEKKLSLLKGETVVIEQLARPHTVKTRMEKCQQLFDERSNMIPPTVDKNPLKIHPDI